MTDRQLTWQQVSARRLLRHGLATPVPAAELAQQVRRICGAHALVMSAAELSVGLRVAGATREDVRAALWSDRSLVKAIGPRGTVHLLLAADLPSWNATLESALEPPGFLPGVRLDARPLDAVIEAIDGALSGGDLMVELDDEVVKRAGAWAGERVMPAFQELWPRWRQAIRPAAARGVLCFGPNRGQRVTYASLRRWLPAYRPMPPGEAARTVLRRYLHAYGPAAPEHFGRWIGSSHGWARDLFRRAADELEPVDVDGVVLWQLAGEEVGIAGASGIVRLLPYFDAYAVGCQPRDRLFPGRAAERGLARTQAGNVPVLLIDDVVAGIWQQRRSGRRLAVVVETFTDLTAHERQMVDEQVKRIAEIQEATATLTYGTVTAGPHA